VLLPPYHDGNWHLRQGARARQNVNGMYQYSRTATSNFAPDSTAREFTVRTFTHFKSVVQDQSRALLLQFLSAFLSSRSLSETCTDVCQYDISSVQYLTRWSKCSSSTQSIGTSSTAAYTVITAILVRSAVRDVNRRFLLMFASVLCRKELWILSWWTAEPLNANLSIWANTLP
jgi:hypothetical protein